MIYQLKITLERTGVWRRLLVDEEMTFRQLHQLVQLVFEWEDCHLHQFTMKDIPEDKMEQESDDDYDPSFYSSDTAIIGDPEDEDGGGFELFFNENEEILGDWLYLDHDSCVYTYDFGDDWQHRILLEKTIAPLMDRQYPICLKSKGIAPEEDSRGAWEVSEASKTKEPNETVITKQINQKLRGCAYSLVGEDFTLRSQESIDEAKLWSKLYALAEEFKKLEPWLWMSDIDLFAVSDEAIGEVGYCCVLGEGQEVFGLAVYRGDRGLRTLQRIMDNKVSDTEAPYEQDSLLLSFEDRQDLTENDYAQIQFVGLKFRGRKAWPSFRSYEPGYVPWPLNDGEVLVMCKALEQAIVVSTRVRIDPNLLNGLEGNHIFTRFSTNTKTGNTHIWSDGMLSLEPLKAEVQEYALVVSEIELAALKKYKRGSAKWEYDLFYAPIPVQDDEEEEERPYYPQFSLCMDQQSGLVIHHDVVGKADQDQSALLIQRHIVTIVKSVGSLPASVLVEDDQTYAILRPLCQQLRIQLDKVDELPLMKHVKAEMFSIDVSQEFLY